jgi:hypothetical protein
MNGAITVYTIELNLSNPVSEGDYIKIVFPIEIEVTAV